MRLKAQTVKCVDRNMWVRELVDEDGNCVAELSCESDRIKLHHKESLFVAAPEMLETLEYCKTWFEKFAPVADMIDGKVGELPMLTSVKAAIAKARGEQP